jgi:hypothetical protein
MFKVHILNLEFSVGKDKIFEGFKNKKNSLSEVFEY